MTELNRRRQAVQTVQQCGQIAAVVGGSGEIRRQLDQYRGKPWAKRLDSLPVKAELLAQSSFPFVGECPGQFGGKEKMVRGLGGHPGYRLGPGHLIPGVVQLDNGKRTGIKRQHVGRFGSGRVETVVHPLRIRIAAGSDKDLAVFS